MTICTDDGEYLFGDICDGKMKLSPIGDITRRFWLEIPKHFQNVKLDRFVIMPNHVHGIILLMDDGEYVYRRGVIRRGVQLNASTSITNVPTNTYATISASTTNYCSKISPQRNTLSVIIRTFKGALTRWCKNNGFEYFKWQRNYYEHIVRNGREFNAFRKYIIYNPKKWELDRENPKSKVFNLDHDLYWRKIL